MPPTQPTTTTAQVIRRIGTRIIESGANFFYLYLHLFHYNDYRQGFFFIARWLSFSIQNYVTTMFIGKCLFYNKMSFFLFYSESFHHEVYR
jgi:hypothetical protein